MSVPKLNSRNIISLLAKKGYKASVISVNRIDDLKGRIENLHNGGLLDESLFEDRLNIFDFDISEVTIDAKSIIVVTTVQPIVQVGFYHQGFIHRLTVPPTYSNFTDKAAYEILSEIMEADAFKLKSVHLPEKALLVMSGVARYGRNNIAYVDGMGSFHRPASFITDAELDEVRWGDMELHEKCIRCKACIKACPTSAISENRFLINAERCLTYFNEASSQFPSWINSEWHNCIIGCMICQNICPINKAYMENIDDSIIFSEEETMQILRNAPIRELSPNTVDKLREIGLIDDYNLLSRNLGVLMKGVN